MPAQIGKGKPRSWTSWESPQPLTADQIASGTQLNPRHTQRLLLKLFEVGEIKRQKLESPQGGRPKYAYYSGELQAPVPPELGESRHPLDLDELL